MNLKILVPTETIVDRKVDAVTAEAQNGSFCLLPRHVDFVAALVPGILSFQPKGGKVRFYAIDRGVLVKCGNEVLVSTNNAVRGEKLGRLKETIEKKFKSFDEGERKALNAVNKIEAGIVRRFLEIQRIG